MSTPTSPDVLSFETLYQQHYASVYRRALALMHAPEEAEEVTQEAFLKAFRAWGRLQPPCDYKAWLYRIVTNAAYDALRKRQHSIQALSVDAVPWETLDATARPPDEQYEQRELIRAALAQLTPQQRQAVLLRMQGYQMRQIAEIMSKTGGSPSPSAMFVKRACVAFFKRLKASSFQTPIRATHRSVQR